MTLLGESPGTAEAAHRPCDVQHRPATQLRSLWDLRSGRAISAIAEAYGAAAPDTGLDHSSPNTICQFGYISSGLRQRVVDV